MIKAAILALSIFGTIGEIHDRYLAPGYVRYKADLGLINKGNDSKDDIFYNPNTGDIIVGITNHPQFSGYNGEVLAPGDCWGVINGGIPHAQLVTDGNKIILYQPHTGLERTIVLNITLIPGCDTTDAF